MQTRTLIQAIAATAGAYHRCVSSGNREWQAKHAERLHALERELPSGSGIDSGTKIDVVRSNDNRVLLEFGFHHMDANGSYDGWTLHTAVITPAFHGINIAIRGRNRNGIKEYLYQVFDHALQLAEPK